MGKHYIYFTDNFICTRLHLTIYIPEGKGTDTSEEFALTILTNLPAISNISTSSPFTPRAMIISPLPPFALKVFKVLELTPVVDISLIFGANFFYWLASE